MERKDIAEYIRNENLKTIISDKVENGFVPDYLLKRKDILEEILNESEEFDNVSFTHIFTIDRENPYLSKSLPKNIYAIELFDELIAIWWKDKSSKMMISIYVEV